MGEHKHRRSFAGMGLEKRVGRLEEEELEEIVDERVVAEITEMLEVLEERLDRETFLRVARILAEAGGEGVR
jgi:hypothetical protein